MCWTASLSVKDCSRSGLWQNRTWDMRGKHPVHDHSRQLFSLSYWPEKGQKSSCDLACSSLKGFLHQPIYTYLNILELNVGERLSTVLRVLATKLFLLISFTWPAHKIWKVFEVGVLTLISQASYMILHVCPKTTATQLNGTSTCFVQEEEKLGASTLHH